MTTSILGRKTGTRPHVSVSMRGIDDLDQQPEILIPLCSFSSCWSRSHTMTMLIESL